MSPKLCICPECHHKDKFEVLYVNDYVMEATDGERIFYAERQLFQLECNKCNTQFLFKPL